MENEVTTSQHHDDMSCHDMLLLSTIDRSIRVSRFDAIPSQLRRESNPCLDCGTELNGRTDWEPVTYRGEHRGICAPCIDHSESMSEYASLNYAYVQNTSVENPLISADDIAEFWARELNPDIEEDCEP